MTSKMDPIAGATRCTVAVGLALGVGLVAHRPLAGMVMAGGAMASGFASFQQVFTSRTKPMGWVAVGMCLATFAGTLGRHLSWGPLSGVAFLAAGAGWATGLLAAVSPGALWMGQQCVVALLVAGAYPASFTEAATRAGLILAGGALQIIVTWVFWRVRAISGFWESVPVLPPGGWIAHIRAHSGWRTGTERYALRLAAALFLTVAIPKLWALHNGYWIPMTLLFVLKPNFQQTWERAVARVTGTLAGAGIATLIAALVHPGPATLAVCVMVFAWLAYALRLKHYAFFSLCMTSYIVFLLAFAGLPETTVVFYRSVNTAIGGALALLIALT